MDVITSLLENIPIPKLVPVRQSFPGAQIEDVQAAIEEEVHNAGLDQCIVDGNEIAIAVGSRGIDRLPAIVRGLVQVVKSRGGHPFIVPAMGSHGGATAEGQETMLAHLGVTEESVGAPVRSSMDVVELGTSEGGLPIYFDRHAYNADGIIVLNRVKPHTSFRGKVESGLLKMITIGLGKQKGADTAHALGFDHMADHIIDISRTLIRKVPLLFGVAIIENGYDKTARVVAVPTETMLDEEPNLLEEARRLMPKIGFNPLDVLIVDEIGKDISGVGMDPNVTGRFPNNLVSGDLQVSRITVLRLTDRTDGNGAGLGLADISTAAAEAKLDRVKGYANSLTSTTMSTCKIPMILENDRLAIQAALKTCNCPDLAKARVVRIKNTLHVDDIWISESLLAEAKQRHDMQILGSAAELLFDEQGNLSL